MTKALRDYLEEEVGEKYYLSQKMITSFIKKDAETSFKFNPSFMGEGHSPCLTARYYKMAVSDPYIKEPILKQVGELDIKGADSTRRVYSTDGICPTMTTMQGGNRQPKIQIKSATSKGYETATQNDSINFTHPNSKTRRGRVGKGVAQTLDCSCNQAVIDEYKIRRLTPRECFRLQGIKDKDISLVNSDTQSYKIAGNAIEVNSMRSIIRQLYKAEKPKDTLF